MGKKFRLSSGFKHVHGPRYRLKNVLQHRHGFSTQGDYVIFEPEGRAQVSSTQPESRMTKLSKPGGMVKTSSLKSRSVLMLSSKPASEVLSIVRNQCDTILKTRRSSNDVNPEVNFRGFLLPKVLEQPLEHVTKVSGVS